MSAAQQLILDLHHRTALEAEDFIVSASNSSAVQMIDLWPNWPARVMAITGPKGSGKTHLANVWRLNSGARSVAAKDLDEAMVIEMAAIGCAVVEDVDLGIKCERALFHLLNLAKEQGVNVLLTAQTGPGHWPVELPDLRSRVRTVPGVAIDTPDASLLSAVLLKLLSDRQLPATPPAVSHLARHMERSMEFAMQLVDALDRAVWQEQREITRDIAKRVLGELQGEQDGD